MKKFIALVAIIPLFLACQPKEEIMPKQELLSLLHNQEDKIHVVNFWSITCKPCIVEMPQFTELARTHPHVSMTLIGLDGIEQQEKHMKFIEKHKITKYSRLLDAPVYHEWMEEVDKNYWGTMPATLIYNHAKDQRIFLNRELEEGELKHLVDSLTTGN
ncbi:MAG: TlpA family protein disulfide reductase [Cyclobacteriaceae bacterium]